MKQERESFGFKSLGNSYRANSMSGTVRALVANMVTGVTKRFDK